MVVEREGRACSRLVGEGIGVVVSLGLEGGCVRGIMIMGMGRAVGDGGYGKNIMRPERGCTSGDV